MRSFITHQRLSGQGGIVENWPLRPHVAGRTFPAWVLHHHQKGGHAFLGSGLHNKVAHLFFFLFFAYLAVLCKHCTSANLKLCTQKQTPSVVREASDAELGAGGPCPEPLRRGPSLARSRLCTAGGVSNARPTVRPKLTGEARISTNSN